MEFLRGLYFSFDEDAKVEIFKGLIFYFSKIKKNYFQIFDCNSLHYFT